MQKVTPFLWYNGQAEEAAALYTSLFENAKIVAVMGNQSTAPGVPGPVMSVTIQIGEQQYILFNGGPSFTFTPAISLFVNCETQEEVDRLWQRLAEGGRTDRCGWLQDKYGVSWQIVPSILGQLLQDEDATKAKRVMDAMLKMTKLDIAVLQQAANG